MKKTRIALAIAASAMITQPVLATNGDHLIGLGAQARAMGGTGTAAFFGSENALTNPALLGKSQGTEFVIGGTVFMPSVKSEATTFSPPGQSASKTSANDLNIIPEVSLSSRINDNWTFGVGIFGSAGMGVDYRDNPQLIDGYSNLQLMKFAPTLAYNDDRFGIGFAPVLQYGALDINYKQYDPTTGNLAANIGNGMSSDLGWGFNLGGYFDVTDNLTLGLAYQSAIDMKYKDQISDASEPFVNPAQGMLSQPFSDNLEQPAEIKVGIAYNHNNWMFTADAKQIQWGEAKGYKDFNWENQNVFGLGARYTNTNYWVGVGYNYGEDPIKKKADTSPANQVVNLFNNHLFPAVIEQHFTFGGGYSLTKNIMLEGAVVYAPEVSKTVNTGFISQQPDPQATSHKVTHSQLSYTFALKMNF